MSINLGESFLAGLRAPFYANGRLLTAEDLRADQEATHGRLGLLGQAVGAGVARGFEVSQVANNLRVTAGLGVNRRGQAVSLNESSVELSLAVLPSNSAATPEGGRFNDCQIAPANGGALVESGAYLLAAAPVAQLQGSVAVKTISTTTTTCASRWEVEGVQFKAIRLANAPARNANNAARYRNQLAHWCLGTETLRSLTRQPFTFPARYSGLDLLTDADLGECDLPLAVFYWERGVLTGVDPWVARRPITPPFPAEAWHAAVAGRHLADAQARFLQFQDQIDDVVQGGKGFPDPTAVYGGAVFRWLPPVGFLPIRPSRDFITQLIHQVASEHQVELSGETVKLWIASILKRLPTGRAFELESFFGSKLPYYLRINDRAMVIQRLHSAWHIPAIDFDALPDIAQPNDQTPLQVQIVAEELVSLVRSLIPLSGRIDLNRFMGKTENNPLNPLDRPASEDPAFQQLRAITSRSVVSPDLLKRTLRTLTDNLAITLEPFELDALAGVVLVKQLPPVMAVFSITEGPDIWIESPRGRG